MLVKKVFFSYSRTDGAAFALRLAADLKQVGFNVWIDQKDIRAGTEWDLEIEKALETCDCLLFIETAHSVTSNNVLDEVYYALEQNKMVVPVILHDSKTPFRLQRLQHVDFSKDYHGGLDHLIRELRGRAATDFFQSSPRPLPGKSANYKWIAIGIFLVGIVGAVIYFLSTQRTAPAELGEQKLVSRVDTPASAPQLLPAEHPDSEAGEEVKRQSGGRKAAQRSTRTNLLNAYSGTWRLVDVKPNTGSFRGYLKIDPQDENLATVKTYVQFYFPKTNDTAYLSVFNGFAGCSSCLLQKEMKLVTEDIAIGTQRYTILQRDVAGVGKAGDTTSSAGGNKSIRAAVTMHLADEHTVLIKVSRPNPAELSYGILMNPFEYTFRFKKSD